MPLANSAQLIESLNAANANALRGICQLLLIDSSGNDATKRNRLKSFVDGPAIRHRRNWLDLALQCHNSGVDGELGIGLVLIPIMMCL